jgi:hypothetical protein
MTTTLATISAALEQRIREKIQEQYNRSDLTANLLAKRRGKGKNCAYDITVGTDTGQIFDDGQVVSTFQTDTELLATLNWAEYGDAFKITGRAEDVAEGDNTELGRLFLKRLMQTRGRAAEKVNTDVWTGDGTGSPQKLLGITASAGPLDSTGIYAGQNRATYPQWAGNVYSNGGIVRAVNLDLFEIGFQDTGTASGQQPTFGITTPAIWRRVASLVAPERRSITDLTIRGQKLTVQMGFNAIEINGVPLFKDKAVPSGMCAFFNEAHIGLEYLPVAQSRIQRGKVRAMVPLNGTPQEMDGKVPGGEPLMAALIELPAAGNFDNWMLDATIQLWCDQPNSHFLIKDLGA